MRLARSSVKLRALQIHQKRSRDPEWIINNALRTMKENQIRNRDLAVQAMTQANMLQNLVRQELCAARAYIKEAALAKREGKTADADNLRSDAEERLRIAKELKPTLQDAQEKVRRIKFAICEEEAAFRRANFRALHLKALLQACEFEGHCQAIMDGLRDDGYLDLPPESVQPDRSEDSLLPPSTADANPDPQTQTPRSRRRRRGKR